MPKSGMTIVRKPRHPPRTQYKIVRDEVRKRLMPVADEHEKQRSDIVRDWQAHHRPKFKSIVGVGPKQIFVQTRIENGSKSLGKYGGTIKDLWTWINEGTKPHVILPRFKTILRFVINGVVIWAKRIPKRGGKRKGLVGRQHNERINDRLNKRFQRAVNNGYRAGLRKIKS